MRPPKQAPLILLIFVIAQVLDGVLTYIGVSRFGPGVEMNALLVIVIGAFGPAAAIVSAKLLSCLCGAILYWTAMYRPLAAAAGFQIGFAVIPWLAVMTFLI